jgi:hypothetical protein
MAVKRGRKSKRIRRRLRHVVKGGPFRLREKPAAAEPAAASDTQAHNDQHGILRFDEGTLHVPGALAEAGESESNGLMPGPVVTVITILAVAFIAVIAWFVSQMPEK